MTTICLGKTHGLYIKCWIKVCVKKEFYGSSKLFHICKHELNAKTAFDIFLFKRTDGSRNCLTLRNTSWNLQCVDVYYNQHDNDTTPLMFVLFFANGLDGGSAKSRYYRMSCFEKDQRTWNTINISCLCKYTGESSILCPLMEENDHIPGLLTYDILKRPSNGGSTCRYNCGKIQVTKNGNANGDGPKLGSEFTQYKHEPVTNSGGSNGNNGSKNAFIVYNCQALMGCGGMELAGVQNQQYKYVKVYFGCRAKRPVPSTVKDAKTCTGSGAACRAGSSRCTPAPGAGDTCKPDPGTCPAPTPPAEGAVCLQDVPLMLELHKNVGDNEPDYYVHRRPTTNGKVQGPCVDQYYWARLGCSNGDKAGACVRDGSGVGKCALKDLLEDIGLPTTKNGDCQARYFTLKKLLSAAPTDGGAAYGVDSPSSQSEEDNGSEIVVLNTNGQNGAKTMLTLLLKRIEFDITESVVILLDKCECKTGPTDDGYGDEQIKQALSGMDPRDRGQRINALKINNGAKITVKCATCSNGDGPCKCLKQYGYCVVVHDFCKPVEKLGDKCSVGLRFFIPTENGNGLRSNGENGTKYRELSLYAGTDKTGPAGLEYLYYTRGDNGASGQNGCAAVPPSGGRTCLVAPGASDCAKAFVVFYHGGCGCPYPGGGDGANGCKGDPRPLMLCYNGCWYRPKDKTSYFIQWVQVPGLGDKGKCACPTEPRGGTSCAQCDKLLGELTKVVGFLNIVDLSKHPKATAEGAVSQCQPSSPGVKVACSATGTTGADTACPAAEPGSNGSKCTYVVHTFDCKQVKVQVECCPVSNGKTGSSSTCYKKLTHRPIGICNGGDGSSGANGPGFRLGDIYHGNCRLDYYCGGAGRGGTADGSGCPPTGVGGHCIHNGGSENGRCSVCPPSGASSNFSQHKYNPLLCVSVYYYDEDKSYCDPLLVELTFENVKCNGVADGLQNGAKEYYRLTCDNPGGLTWARVDNGCKSGLENPQCLVKYLDWIRYCLKKVVRIQLECKGTNGGDGAGNGYDLKGRAAKGGTAGQFCYLINNGACTNGNGKVQVCESKCESLTSKNYKCFRHCLTSALTNKHHKVAGLVFTLPCQPNGGAGQSGTCCVNGATSTSGTNGFVEIPVCIVGESKCGDGTKTDCPPVTPSEGQGTCSPDTGEGLCTAVTPGEGLCPAGPPGDATCPAAPPSPSIPCTNGKTDTKIPPILYNRCMGDVYVYFYACKNGGTEACTVGTGTTCNSSSSSSCSPKNGGSETDTVPLMVRFNGHFYKPCDRDNYFTKWVCIPGLCKKQGECQCCCCGTGSDGCLTKCPEASTDQCKDGCDCCKELVQQLNAVNESLNRIDLDKSSLANCSSATSNGSTKGYGLPEKCKDGGVRGCKLASSVGNDRICLTENKPKNGANDASQAYTRIVHRTTNGFRIGCITYCGQDFATNGVNLSLLNKGACKSGVGFACPSTSGPGDAQTCTINTGEGVSCSASAQPGNGQNCTIKVANGTKTNGQKNHTELLKTCQCNTVVVYYSCSDKCMWLPQLIVILQTENGVETSKAVTAGNGNKKYGYYILATKNGDGAGSTGFEYKWVYVNGKEPQSEVKLDEATDFRLLNAAVLLLHCRVRSGSTASCCSYGETQICQAVKSAIQQNRDLASPGNDNDVNRLQYRDITVTDESEKGTCASADASSSPGTCCCKCLNQTGFKVMTHDLCPLVTLNGKFKAPLCNVRLITGLKFLIPTRNKGEYKHLTLNGRSKDANGSNNVKYHKPENNKMCVYFYGSDPRPLLLCYNGWAYRANSMCDYDCQKWAECKEAAKCGCTQAPGTCQFTQEQGKCDQCPLLKALVQVSDFLNPVDIKQVPPSTGYSRFCCCYQVHQFNGQRVWIRVSAQFACGSFCYNRFTHTHAGIRGKGDGFRLGNIHYGNGTGKNGVANGSSTCIKLTNGKNNGDNGCINSLLNKNGQSSGGKPCETASHVVAFYYKLDSEHKTPIVVALCENGTSGTSTCYKLECKLYYVLKNREVKTYTKGTNGLTMDDEKKLAKELDDALFKNAKKLQIVLSQRPQPAKYSEGSDNKKCIVNGLKNGETSGQDELRTCKFNLSTELEESKQDSLLYHVGKETSYEANLCEKNGTSESPSSSQSTITVTVTQVRCDKSYSDGGYRCFKHVLVNASGISEVGGLKLCLWVDKGGAGQGSGGKCAPCTEQGGGTGNDGLKLCNGSASTTNGSIQLSYTTCKGDLYVFFYDEDPRPLMVCYDGEAYRPEKMADYCSKWVKVNNGDKKCVENGQVKADPQILQALYRVSMFLNPVYLWMCNTDYQKLDPKHGQSDGAAQGQQGQNGSSGQNGHKQPDQAKHHSYAIHRESRPPICIKVAGRDLRCYKEYVHAPAKQGFRLGEVRYVKAAEGGGKPGASTNSGQCQTTAVPAASAASTCSPSTNTGTTNTGSCSANTATYGASSCSTPTTTPTTTSPANNGFCFYYDCKKQLQTVSLYHYMYDKCHNWPLVVMLSYKGQSSEFFRLCCPGTAGGAGDGDTSGGGTCQGSGGGGNGSGGGDSNGQKCSRKKVDPGCLKWVKMGAKSSGKGAGGKDSCGNGSGAAKPPNGTTGSGMCQPCPGTQSTGTSGTNGVQAADSTRAESAEERKRMCAEDLEFVQRAQELYRSVHAWDVPSSVFTEDRLPLTRELSDLIEERAYSVRRALKLQYNTEDEKCLILSTPSRCWEEWPLAYIVGGGALSVAAGGSWKFVVMAVGVFVKL